jgi:hypothetical protein
MENFPQLAADSSKQHLPPSLGINTTWVGVGIIIAYDPLHGSGRAGFPHQMFSTTFDAQCAEVKDVAKLF